MKRAALAVTSMSMTFFATASVRAADGGLVDELTMLEREVASTHAKYTQGGLSADDCTLACRALSSMRKAAEKICALEPGPRCDDARRRTNDVEGIVRTSCPFCATANKEGRDEPRAHTKADDSARPAARPTPVSPPNENSVPASEPRRGGCASCATSGRESSIGGVCGAALFVLALGIRRRARRERR